MKKKTVLKDYISFTLFYVNIMIIFFNIMLLAELNTCYLFYSISLNIVFINFYILNKKASQKFKTNLLYNIFDDEI